MRGTLLVPRRYTPPLLQLADEALDEAALAVEAPGEAQEEVRPRRFCKGLRELKPALFGFMKLDGA